VFSSSGYFQLTLPLNCCDECFGEALNYPCHHDKTLPFLGIYLLLSQSSIFSAKWLNLNGLTLRFVNKISHPQLCRWPVFGSLKVVQAMVVN
jgi:hypothetical protein